MSKFIEIPGTRSGINRLVNIDAISHIVPEGVPDGPTVLFMTSLDEKGNGFRVTTSLPYREVSNLVLAATGQK